MDYKTLYMRSLRDVTSAGKPEHYECRTNGDQACGRRVLVPHEPKDGSIQGFQWLPKHLRPMDLDRPWETDFSAYATQWEQRNSILVSSRSGLVMAPVVDHNALLESGSFPVIAHYGAVTADEVIVRRKYASSVPAHDQLQLILDQDIVAYAERGYPDAGDWGPLGSYSSGNPVFFTVLTDLEGRILLNMGSFGSEAGLESVDPLDYVMVGTILVDLAKIGGKLVLAMARKGVKKAITSLAKKKVTQEAEETAIQLAREQVAKNLEKRSKSYARPSGITPKHFQGFQDAARETNLIAVVRNGNEAAIPLIEKGCPGKPKIFEPFNTSKSSGILTATTEADKELVLKSKYILIDDTGAAVRRLSNGSLEKVELNGPFWRVEPGQVIDPALKKPVVGDYDLMGVFSPASPGQNITLHSVGGDKLKNMTSPLVDKFSASVNAKFDMKRVLHGAQDQYAGFRKGATAFFPDGTVLYMETQQEVEAFYDVVGRQTIKGTYRTP